MDYKVWALSPKKNKEEEKLKPPPFNILKGNIYFLIFLKKFFISSPAASLPPNPKDNANATATEPNVSPNAKFTILSAIPIVCNPNAKNIPNTANFAIGTKYPFDSELDKVFSTKLEMNNPAIKIIRPKNTLPVIENMFDSIASTCSSSSLSHAAIMPVNIIKNNATFPRIVDNEL